MPPIDSRHRAGSAAHQTARPAKFRSSVCALGARGRVDPGREAAGATDGVVEGQEEGGGLRDGVRVEALVLARGPGEVPRVDERVGADQPTHQRLEGLLAEGSPADHLGGAGPAARR